jgi:hypothetical protein
LDQKSVLAWNFVLVFYGLFPQGIGSIFLEKYFAVMFTGVQGARSARECRAAVTLHTTFLAAL